MSAVSLIECDPDDPAALVCLERYYAELAAQFPGGFEVGRSRDPAAAQLLRPLGSFVLALCSFEPVGCIALKGSGGSVAEIKRMWLDPAQRGTGLARRLMTQAEEIARELGTTTLRLDTNRALTKAIATYRHWGWTEIPRFNDDPYAEVFFEKAL